MCVKCLQKSVTLGKRLRTFFQTRNTDGHILRWKAQPFLQVPRSVHKYLVYSLSHHPVKFYEACKKRKKERNQPVTQEKHPSDQLWNIGKSFFFFPFPCIIGKSWRISSLTYFMAAQLDEPCCKGTTGWPRDESLLILWGSYLFIVRDPKSFHSSFKIKKSKPELPASPKIKTVATHV